mmetsp:Transcript_3070/g.6165  ORF Transcript_3070/g.6165 Transcript_3070/m.6165 type:complete len:204 (+) Transcript_3070:271-882(+)
MPKMLRDTVLVRLDGCTVKEYVSGWYDLEIILVHPVRIFNVSGNSIQLIRCRWIVRTETNFLKTVRHIPFLHGLKEQIQNVHGCNYAIVTSFARCNVQVSSASRQRDHAVYIASFSFLILLGLLALYNGILILQHPALAFICPLNIVAGITALSFFSGAITTTTTWSLALRRHSGLVVSHQSLSKFQQILVGKQGRTKLNFAP